MGLQNEKIAALSFVTAELNYLAPSLERPRNYTFEPPPGVSRSNTVSEPHALAIHNARPIQHSMGWLIGLGPREKCASSLERLESLSAGDPTQHMIPGQQHDSNTQGEVRSERQIASGDARRGE